MDGKTEVEKKLFGIGVEDDEDLQALMNSTHPKHPANVADKMVMIMAYLEQNHVTTRDNNAIMYQMINSMEERLNKKIEHLRDEMIALIHNSVAARLPPAQSSSATVTPAAAPSPAKASRRASTSEVKSRIDKYAPAPAIIPVQNGTSAEVFYDMVDITPEPGFVIKTRKLIGDKNKVFINLFHHKQIALFPPGLTIEQATDKPYLMMEAPTLSTDRLGQDCLTFNVGISSEYFTQPNPKIDINITAPATIYKIIHKINLKFNEFLDEGNYSIPRLATGYKGDELPTFRVPQLRATRRDSGTEILAAGTGNGSVTPPTVPKSSKSMIHDATPGAESSSSNDSTPTGGIASIWAATSHFDEPEVSIVHPPPPSAHPAPSAGASTASTRRASESNDTESVMSDVTAASAAPAPVKQLAQRRSSLNMLMALTTRNPSVGSMDGANGATPAAQPTRKLTRKSVLVSPANAGYNGGAIQGRNLLSGDMLEYLPDQNIDNTAAQELQQSAIEDPAVLLGWQIWVQEDGENVMYVVTDVRKNFLSKTEYRISRYKADDQWVKLKRQDGKNGLEFRPMRKVLFGLQDDDDTVA